MISYKIFFQLMVTVFKENADLELPRVFSVVLDLYLK